MLKIWGKRAPLSDGQTDEGRLSSMRNVWCAMCLSACFQWQSYVCRSLWATSPTASGSTDSCSASLVDTCKVRGKARRLYRVRNKNNTWDEVKVHNKRRKRIVCIDEFRTFLKESTQWPYLWNFTNFKDVTWLQNIKILSSRRKSRGFTRRWCHSVCLFVCRLNAYLSGTGLNGRAVLAAVSGRSAARPVSPVPDVLMAVGAYRVVLVDLLQMIAYWRQVCPWQQACWQ